MINGVFRPWGKPDWLLRTIAHPPGSWLLIGTLSTQTRCLSMLIHSATSYSLAKAEFLEITDSNSPFEIESTRLRNENRAEIVRIAPNQHAIHQFGLMDPSARLKKLALGWLGAGANNVILDATCMPERFLFPIMRWLVEETQVSNLIVTCMAPAKYTDQELAYDPNEWAQLPTFTDAGGSGITQKIRRVIVGAGFMPFGLPDLLKKTYIEQGVKVSIIFPFPASPVNVSRAWEFVRKIEHDIPISDERQVARVGVDDLPGCFDRISAMTAEGKLKSVFAPYGPKAHSVAMALHAIKTGAEVYYTQPAYYHPHYTDGIKFDGTTPVGSAYAIRVQGREYY
jgi:hypothetical protein